MMKTYRNPPPEEWVSLTKRPVLETEELFPLVEEVFTAIRKDGDQALAEYTLRFDQVELKSFRLRQREYDEAAALLAKDLKSAMAIAYDNLCTFHRSQEEQSPIITTTPGVKCWRESRAIQKVGFYIPGGSAPLFSTVLMLGVPAQIAGCEEVVLCSPPNKEGKLHPAIIYAAQLTGITRVYKLGGIQAIGAMAIGTPSIPKADKIFGPGNQYVTAAKQVAQHYGTAIDMPAGPSEVLIIADQTAVPAFVAADLLSQAEHGPDSQVMLLSDSPKTIDRILEELAAQLPLLPRETLAARAVANSKAICFDNLETCMDFSNAYAPEHLILAVDNPEEMARQVTNAGSVFLGHYSCESAGDYASGTNHTLPTNAYAKAYSGVSLDSFVKKITFQHLSKEGLQNIGKAIEVMAEAESLHAHKKAVSLRLKSL